MNRITRSYTPKHKIEEVVNTLDKLVKQMTPRQKIEQNNFQYQNTSPIRQSQIHLKQIELQRQSIDILQQQIRDKSLENEQLKQQKQIIRQISATGNKFIQNFGLEQSNLQDSPISRHSYQTSQTLPNFANKEQDLLQGALPSQFDLSIEQKNIQNLVLQNQILEEKNTKFKQLIQLMENKYNSKLQAYQQKEQKLEDKCKFLFSTLEGKDKEIKEIIQIQQNMLQKTIKEIEDKYRQDMLQLKQDIIQLREELQQKDLLIQERSYEILAKEETITQLKVKYLEIVKQNLAKGKASCLSQASLQNTEGNYVNDQQNSQLNKNDQIPQLSQNNLKNVQIDQNKGQQQQQSRDFKNNLQENEQPTPYKIDQSNQNNTEFSSSLTFKQSNPCQSQNENNFNSQQYQEQVERDIKTSQSQLNKTLSNVFDNGYNNKISNQPQQQNHFNKYDQDNIIQQNQQTNSPQHKHLFEKVQKSKSQLQNIQNFLQLSKPEKSEKSIHENQFNLSQDLKLSSQSEKMHFLQSYSNKNKPASNKSQIQSQTYQKENEFQLIYPKNKNNMNKSMVISSTESQYYDRSYQKQIDPFRDDENLVLQTQNDSNILHLKHSNSCEIEQSNKLFFNKNNRSEIMAFQNQNKDQNQSQNQFNEISQRDLSNQFSNELNQSKELNKIKSKLYTLKLEQAEAWRNTYSNMYGKSPIYNNKNIKQNKSENNI
ncbi:hypothetical protein ABPG74_021885 [Tetrahymena malaccensis]